MSKKCNQYVGYSYESYVNEETGANELMVSSEFKFLSKVSYSVPMITIPVNDQCVSVMRDLLSQGIFSYCFL